MRTLIVRGSRGGQRFSNLMEQLITHCEHLGVMCGGGWDVKTPKATFYPYAHSDKCCTAVPHLSRITPGVRALITLWCNKRGLETTWRKR